MPLRLTVGVCRKIGLPNYGSNGANCTVELELDSALLDRDPQALLQRINDAFQICEQSVATQLAKEKKPEPEQAVGATGAPTSATTPRSGSHRPATASQRRAITNMAYRKKIELANLIRERFGLATIDQLELYQASQLIDELKGNSVPAESIAS
jgi:hypothetical protein